MSNNFYFRLLSTFLIAPTVILFIYLGEYFFNSLILIILIIGIYEIIKIKIFFYQFFILFLLLFFLYSCIQIINLNNGKYIILYIIFVTWISDVSGYIFGKIVGGKKINFISPNKTYAGFIGSVFSVQFLIYLLSRLDLKYIENYFFNYIFVFICTLTVIFGDLLFSFFKRKCNIKDYSNLIPGHGGLFDRIDGLILLTIFIFITSK